MGRGRSSRFWGPRGARAPFTLLACFTARDELRAEEKPLSRTLRHRACLLAVPWLSPRDPSRVLSHARKVLTLVQHYTLILKRKTKPGTNKLT